MRTGGDKFENKNPRDSKGRYIYNFLPKIYPELYLNPETA